jgi:hypothetical protein
MGNEPISREEFDKLVARCDKLEAELENMKGQFTDIDYILCSVNGDISDLMSKEE